MLSFDIRCEMERVVHLVFKSRMNPNWFSMLFKKENGVNVTNYVNRSKHEKQLSAAKHALRQGFRLWGCAVLRSRQVRAMARRAFPRGLQR